MRETTSAKLQGPADAWTNKLYIADTLMVKFPHFYEEFRSLVARAGIELATLPGTKDIWAVDYMPLQRSDGQFVKFKYDPWYLNTKKLAATKSDVVEICTALGIQPITSEIFLDGGNVVRTRSKAMMCDKILDENKSIRREDLLDSLKSLLNLDEVILLPFDTNDPIGHVDGMARFVTDDIVIVNNYFKESKVFRQKLRSSLGKFDIIELPYDPYSNKGSLDARGIYVNYLQMSGVIVVPIYGMHTDDAAVHAIEAAFPNAKVLTINASNIAIHGGALNCVTWNIRST